MPTKTYRSALLVVSMAWAIACGGSGRYSSGHDVAATPTGVASATPAATPTAAAPLAFAVGGVLASRSDDGGGTWRDVLATDTTLWGVDFLDRATGWVVGTNHIFRTDGGGHDAGAWDDQSANIAGMAPVDLYDVAFRDRDHGVAVGAEPAAGAGTATLVTSDGGADWRRVAVPMRDARDRLWLRRVCLTQEGHGFAVGNAIMAPRPVVLRTVDSGETWTDVTTAAGPDRDVALTGCSFRESADAWVIGSPAFLAVSRDNGEAWMPVSLDPDASVEPVAVLFVDHDHGWVCGFDREAQEIVVFATADGGTTWQRQRLLTADVDEEHRPLAAFAAIDAQSLVLVGTDPNTFQLEGDRPFSFTSGDGGRTWTASTISEGFQSLVDVALVR